MSRPDGCYVSFSRVVSDDNDASPRDYLFQDPAYKFEDQKRMDSFNHGDWRFIGIRAVAVITIVRLGNSITHQIESAGIYGVEDDAGDAYLEELYNEEIAQLKADIAAMASPIYDD